MSHSWNENFMAGQMWHCILNKFCQHFHYWFSFKKICLDTNNSLSFSLARILLFALGLDTPMFSGNHNTSDIAEILIGTVGRAKWKVSLLWVCVCVMNLSLLFTLLLCLETYIFIFSFLTHIQSPVSFQRQFYCTSGFTGNCEQYWQIEFCAFFMTSPPRMLQNMTNSTRIMACSSRRELSLQMSSWRRQVTLLYLCCIEL
jgi:hypothetical protein